MAAAPDAGATGREALQRRSQWNYPEGVKVIGEFWPSSENVAVVSAFETDDHAALMDIGFTWGDVFQIEVAPRSRPRTVFG